MGDFHDWEGELGLRGRTATVADGETLNAALECDLSAYDAEFVVLARTLGVPLVTLEGGS